MKYTKMKNTGLAIAGLVLIAIMVIIRFNLFEKPVARNNRIVVDVQRPGFLDPFVDPIYTYVISSDKPGQIYEKLPPGLGDDARWSPDGQWVTYSSIDFYSSIVETSNLADKSDIYLMHSDGSHRIRLIDHKTGGSYNSAWSADGKEIAYYSIYPDRIFIINVGCILNGDKCSPTPRFLIGGDSPDWSPDGEYLVYTIFGGGIYKISADGTGKQIELTPVDVKICFNPIWSPDGTRIATSCYQEQSKGFEIFIVNSNGSGAVALTEGRMPSWSPDGSKIVFVSERNGLGKCIGGICGSGGIYSNAMYVMNADGSNIVRLSLRNDESVQWYAWVH